MLRNRKPPNAANAATESAIDEEKGIERSQISILAALVKLRQVCCHPRLLKLPVEDEKLGSAKLPMATVTVPGKPSFSQ